MKEEEPQLEEEKIRIMNDNSECKQKMKAIEQQILKMLSQSTNMLEDGKLVESLQESKQTSEEINQRLKEAKITEDRIYLNRLNYEELANLASVFYFTVLKLHQINYMYQFSLDFYVRIFKKAIRTAEKPLAKNIKQRVLNITDQIKKTIFIEISRSIFVKDKLLFSFMILLATYQATNSLKAQELNFIINGLPIKPIQPLDNPDPDYFTHTQWTHILNLSTIFDQIAQSFHDQLPNWKSFLENHSDAIPYEGINHFQ